MFVPRKIGQEVLQSAEAIPTAEACVGEQEQGSLHGVSVHEADSRPHEAKTRETQYVKRWTETWDFHGIVSSIVGHFKKLRQISLEKKAQREWELRERINCFRRDKAFLNRAIRLHLRASNTIFGISYSRRLLDRQMEELLPKYVEVVMANLNSKKMDQAFKDHKMSNKELSVLIKAAVKNAALALQQDVINVSRALKTELNKNDLKLTPQQEQNLTVSILKSMYTEADPEIFLDATGRNEALLMNTQTAVSDLLTVNSILSRLRARVEDKESLAFKIRSPLRSQLKIRSSKSSVSLFDLQNRMEVIFPQEGVWEGGYDNRMAFGENTQTYVDHNLEETVRSFIRDITGIDMWLEDGSEKKSRKVLGDKKTKLGAAVGFVDVELPKAVFEDPKKRLRSIKTVIGCKNQSATNATLCGATEEGCKGIGATCSQGEFIVGTNAGVESGSDIEYTSTHGAKKGVTFVTARLVSPAAQVLSVSGRYGEGWDGKTTHLLTPSHHHVGEAIGVSESIIILKVDASGDVPKISCALAAGRWKINDGLKDSTKNSEGQVLYSPEQSPSNASLEPRRLGHRGGS